MCLLLIRAALPASGLPARRIGIREIGWGAVFVALVSAGFWI